MESREAFEIHADSDVFWSMTVYIDQAAHDWSAQISRRKFFLFFGQRKKMPIFRQ
jgi:hypothetical protein